MLEGVQSQESRRLTLDTKGKRQTLPKDSASPLRRLLHERFVEFTLQ